MIKAKEYCAISFPAKQTQACKDTNRQRQTQVNVTVLVAVLGWCLNRIISHKAHLLLMYFGTVGVVQFCLSFVTTASEDVLSRLMFLRIHKQKDISQGLPGSNIATHPHFTGTHLFHSWVDLDSCFVIQIHLQGIFA